MSEPRPNDDTGDSLRNIVGRHGVSITSLLLDSANKTVEQAKYTKYIKKLEVFSPAERRKRKRGNDGKYVEEKETYLDRDWINAFGQQDYVALSYTWRASEHEKDDEARARTYFVQQSRDGPFYRSPVRDVVFDRAIRYMDAVGARFFWIDRHSIKQETECNESDCGHEPCICKAEALHVMDLVYRQSKYPVALLGNVVKSAKELDLLRDLLKDRLTIARSSLSGESFQIVERKTSQANDTLLLLREITSDLWWTRAWTFQENYRGSDRMMLLMRHAPELETGKESAAVFGDIKGELRFSSVHFSRQATKLCLALSRHSPELPAGDRGEIIKSVLDALGRYTMLLEETEAMSTAVIANVNARDLKDPWDRLDIIANCCQYSLRMDWREIRRSSSDGGSLSAALMAQYLVNGELLHNGEDPSRAARDIARMSVAKALQYLSFNGFRAPRDEADRNWSHNKRCRLLETQITPSGVVAKGHLWELGTIIHTADASLDLRVKNPRVRDLSLECCKHLKWLADKLYDRRCSTLPKKLNEFVRADFPGVRNYRKTFSEAYMSTMAEEVSDAIAERKRLRLGRLWQRSGRPGPYSAVFIWDDGGVQEQEEDDDYHFVFTSTCPEDGGTPWHESNDTARHVSLEVNVTAEETGDQLPRLYTKRWVRGLMFFEGCEREEVLFPWPVPLVGIIPSGSGSDSDSSV
ncbi:hypothetical protein DL764_010050 [Monosporascus ibericus]|uniref:Heterokaryon incompatibility domain-containing protein n=1 Tax=Monosporascus ibericus TaxID=155417 RepID=A0A4Q4SW88_9PEZI|nr:hypothetical protein DL764_010050 [Monosporascus ibericus]